MVTTTQLMERRARTWGGSRRYPTVSFFKRLLKRTPVPPKARRRPQTTVPIRGYARPDDGGGPCVLYGLSWMREARTWTHLFGTGLKALALRQNTVVYQHTHLDKIHKPLPHGAGETVLHNISSDVI
ncbi:hypothetical protein SKAU_G00015950 [Synaphobranchus kaupii]|uniref:Uncharacterized protein n=1 Tax=Synaphobranchus kaupii TaxID=118154 RepID=A0A9Q1JDU0_SYNKA|nr:hypothetical protein SKAU_G00015950 [Synaphobranchus kaupii]